MSPCQEGSVRTVGHSGRLKYSKCPNISYTKVADKILYVNSIDQDQTAPEGAV